jgi:hypothetical protein
MSDRLFNLVLLPRLFTYKKKIKNIQVPKNHFQKEIFFW